MEKIEYLGVDVKTGNFFALIAILISGFSIVKWKEYEQKVLLQITNSSSVPVVEKIKSSPEIISTISLLEKMAIKEKEKIRVMVEHDNSPLTDTYPMIMDATSSFDPDLGDEIQFVWKQIAGPSVKINPHPFAGKVSFEGKEGEYTFELTVLDNYNSKTTITKTVVIIPEPNQPPVIDMKVRQGSELK